MNDRPLPRLRLADRQQVLPAMPLENLLVGVRGTPSGRDRGPLTPLNEQLHDRHGVSAQAALGEGGFAKHPDSEAAAGRGEGCTVEAPVPAPKGPQHDR